MNINNKNKNMQRDNGTEINKMHTDNNNTEGRDEIAKVQKNDVHTKDDVTAIDTEKKKRKRKSPLIPWKKPPGKVVY